MVSLLTVNAGWGSVAYEDIDVSKAPKEPNKKILGLYL